MVGLATVFGAGGGTSSYQEIEETDVVVLWGSNARETHPLFFHRVLQAVNAGAKLFVVDPRRTSSARWADGWLGLDVGTDIPLAHAIGREIIHAGLAATRADHGADAIGMFSCSKSTNEVNFLAQKLMRVAIGSNNIDSCNRT